MSLYFIQNVVTLANNAKTLRNAHNAIQIHN